MVGGKEDMIIKVSDQGRGVSRLDLEKMNSYSGLLGVQWPFGQGRLPVSILPTVFTTAPPPTFTLDQALALSAGVEQEPPFDDVRYYLPLAGFGYGMPISRLYAEYLGGNLEVISMEGYGTGAFGRVEPVFEMISDGSFFRFSKMPTATSNVSALQSSK